MSAAYYNEIDPFAAEWLRRLILFGHIAPGDVDERDIRDVSPDDLKGYEQHHFFAGIGVWSYAARRAGWADDRRLASGSCPCQPFSSAGGRSGFADERHLWPAFHHLIRECEFPVVVGEQVASKDGLAWLDLVSADMEGSGYAGGAVDLCAAGFGAPHIRQRLYFAWLADAEHGRREGWEPQPRSAGQDAASVVPRGKAGELGNTTGATRERNAGALLGAEAGIYGEGIAEHGRLAVGYGASGHARGLVDTDVSGEHERAPSGQQPLRDERDERDEAARSCDPGPINGFWRDGDWLLCRSLDGEPEWRAVEAGTFPLAHGVAGRMGLLRGYGNAINAEVAKGFLEAVMECIP